MLQLTFVTCGSLAHYLTTTRRRRQEGSKAKRERHLRIYRHQDWGRPERRDHAVEWELIRQTYLDQTPLGG
jgi:N-formylglutamate amidohydrolase